MGAADLGLRHALDAAAAATTTAAALAIIEAALNDEQLQQAALLHHARGKLLLQAGRVDDAIAAGQRAIALEPGVPDFASNLGSALLARYRSKKQPADLVAAERVLQDAVYLGPKTPEVRATLVVALLQQGRFDDALKIADDNLAVFVDDEITRFNKAIVLQARGDIVGARALLSALATTFAPAKDALLRLR
ncbi:MAG TPA: tetratricopeptide repeat protein [Myxococcota bacterium]